MTPTRSLPGLARRLSESVYARQVGSTLAGRVAGLFVALGTTAMTARWLGPGGKGKLSILLLAPYMMYIWLNLGIGTANTYFAGSKKLSVPQLTANASLFALLATCGGALVTAILLASGKVEMLLPGITPKLLLLCMFGFPLNLMSLYFQAILLGLRRIFTLNAITFTQAFLVLPLMALLVGWLKLGVPGALLAYLIPQAVMLVPTSLVLRGEGGRFFPRWETRVIKPALDYGLKGFAANLMDFFNYRLDSFLVNYFVGPAGAGIYSASVALAELLFQLPMSASAILFPKAAGSSHETMNKFTPKVFWVVLGISTAGAAGLAVCGKLAIRLIYSNSFSDSYVPLLALLPGVVLVGAARILNNDIYGRGFPHYNSITAGVALVVTVILDLAMIPRLGVLGASIASTVSYSVMFALSVYFYLSVSRRRPAPAVELPLPGALDA